MHPKHRRLIRAWYRLWHRALLRRSYPTAPHSRLMIYQRAQCGPPCPLCTQRHRLVYAYEPHACACGRLAARPHFHHGPLQITWICGPCWRRAWRTTRYFTDPAFKMKQKARTLTGQAIKRGHLIKQPCQQCGAFDVQAHHHDYSKPLDIVWLCKPCHLAEHTAHRV